MMNFRKSVTKSEKRTSCFNDLSWQQRKQHKSIIDKKILTDPQMHMYPLSKFHFSKVAIQELGGGCTQPLPPVKVWIKSTLGLRGLMCEKF